MKLIDLLKGSEVIKVVGEGSVDITGIQLDSQKISVGDLFVAMRGTKVDGHTYISMAVEKGEIGRASCRERV